MSFLSYGCAKTRSVVLKATFCGVMAWGLGALPASAYDGPVEAKVFKADSFTFADGNKLPLQLGYETYGTLNAAKDNAILICHHFGGTSHAAGRYKPEEESAGYWDSLIGSGKAIDTDKYFVIAINVISNVNVSDKRVVTTGPASTDKKGKPYGSKFPTVSIADLVESQKLVLDSLGIDKLYAVVGPSLGGMQALQWSVAYPDRVGRTVVIAAPGRSEGYNQLVAQSIIETIENDSNFKDGDYLKDKSGKKKPLFGLTTAWKLLYSQLGGRNQLATKYPRALNAESKEIPYLVSVGGMALQRAQQADAASWRLLTMASRDFDVAKGYGSYEEALRRIRGPILVMAASTDNLFPPSVLQTNLVEPLKQSGANVTYEILETEMGHIGALGDTAKLAPPLAAFLK